jgi:hypothetical protein
MNAIFAKPEKGDLIFDPSDPENPEKHLIYTGHDWVQAVDPFGEYGGPYMDERELLGNPKARAEMRELAALEAEAAGVSLSQKVFAEYLAKVPAEKRAEAEAVGGPKYAAALEAAAKEAGGADLMRDEIKLGAKARRAFKGYLAEDAAPAARGREKKKGGGSRAATGHGGGGARRGHRATRKGRRASRKGRKASRRH